MKARSLAALAGIFFCAWAAGATEPDDATRRWWSHVQALAGDRMEGRDTGSRGYRRAAAYVVSRFKSVGLSPSGESAYYQPVPLHAIKFRTDRSEISLIGQNGEIRPLRWQHQISLVPRTGIPETFDAPLAFSGWQIPDDLDVRGKILVALAPPRFVPGPRGYAQTPRPGYFGTLVVETAAGPEPVRWPSFSSILMTPASVPLPAQPPGGPSGFNFNPADAEELFAGSGHTYREIRALADAGERLPSFPMAVRLKGRMMFDTLELSSDNIIAVLRGSDPVLADEYVVLSAHLDGYGIGEPVGNDRIYNGAFDDAAYVATLIDLAERLHASGIRFKRSVLFCVFTAEEKGLLGSQYFTTYPTVPKEGMVANINLDTLRPIFPLRSLTTLALNDSTLGDVARRVGDSMNIQIKADAEPDRLLLRRSDQWNFLQAGVPALAFVFGYDSGSPEEAIYRRWYAQRYHSPSDDLNQPWDREGAARFNEFFGRLVEAVANDPKRPAWKPGTSFGPQASTTGGTRR
jgi:hypothetical protein